MFEERGADEVTELRPYWATTWQRISDATEKPPEISSVGIPHGDRETGAFLNGISDVLKPVRKLISEHETWLVTAVVLLLLCDCDDDLELLIAAVILFLPLLSGWHQ